MEVEKEASARNTHTSVYLQRSGLGSQFSPNGSIISTTSLRLMEADSSSSARAPPLTASTTRSSIIPQCLVCIDVIAMIPIFTLIY